MSREALLSSIKGGLIVSCQADPGDPLDDPAIIAALAKAAEAGGAVAIRAEGVANIRAVKQTVSVPVIGLCKKRYPDSRIYITPTLSDALAVASAGADVIALDATARRRPGGLSLARLVRALKQRGMLLMADVSCLEEGVAAAALGFDLIGSTLSGYVSPDAPLPSEPDMALVAMLNREVGQAVPIIAEGRIWTPAQAMQALECGAFAVVVGTAITRPGAITRRIAHAMARYTSLQRGAAVGIDLGGTRTLVGVGSFGGDLWHETTFATPWQKGMTAVVARIVEAVQRLLHSSGISAQAVGVAATGRVDAERGEIVGGVPLAPGYLGSPLRDQLSQRIGLPTHLENDANAAAFAEYRRLPTPRPARFAMVTIGTGVGGGIIFDGQLVRGAGNAGEIGHICVRKGGRSCRCGARGCLEMYVSRHLLAKEVRRLVRAGVLQLPPHRQKLDTEDVMALFLEGIPEIERLVDSQLDFLACGLRSLINTIDPEVIVIGGEISRLQEHLLKRLRARLAYPVKIRCAELGNRAGAIGAAQLALAHLL